MPILKENLIEILFKDKQLSNEQLDKALALQKKKELPLRKILVDYGFISEEALLSLFANYLYVPQLHLLRYKFDFQIVNLIPERIARQYNLICLSRIGDTMTVAMSDPLNVFALDDLKTLTGCKIDIVISPREEINKAIEEQYQERPKEVEEVLKEEVSDSAELEKKELALAKDEEIELTSVIKESQRPPIVKLVELILTQALNKRASDIHIEPECDCLRVRYRIDGALHDAFGLPKANQNAILARVKIISGLDITENRLPQDGRFKVKFEGRQIDFRVSSLPTVFGQKFVLRILDKTSISIGLEKLGFTEDALAIFNEAIVRPFGMILVTGPTGSGKSTTLYSALSKLNTPQRNIITIEDPVEYQIEGLTQIQVKPEIGLDFSSGLRSLLRQSPDVIMIGEIRDSETADIAIKAALTGQLVLSTLHTNDAISSITRLIDMQVEPFLVASSLIMLCAQRLCRKLCVKCKGPVDIDEDFLRKIGFALKDADLKERPRFYSAVGCKYCNNTGFYGRIAIVEAVLVDDNLRELIIRKRSLDEIRDYATKAKNMRSLRDDAFLKVRQELTTLEEALRITTEE
jgi:type IV pilus assembly protein PilB